MLTANASLVQVSIPSIPGLGTKIHVWVFYKSGLVCIAKDFLATGSLAAISLSSQSYFA